MDTNKDNAAQAAPAAKLDLAAMWAANGLVRIGVAIAVLVVAYVLPGGPIFKGLVWAGAAVIAASCVWGQDRVRARLDGILPSTKVLIGKTVTVMIVLLVGALLIASLGFLQYAPQDQAIKAFYRPADGWLAKPVGMFEIWWHAGDIKVSYWGPIMLAQYKGGTAVSYAYRWVLIVAPTSATV